MPKLTQSFTNSFCTRLSLKRTASHVFKLLPSFVVHLLNLAPKHNSEISLRLCSSDGGRILIS